MESLSPMTISSADICFALFDTAIGPCAIAWAGETVVGSRLPEGTVTTARARMQQRFPAAREAEAPPAIQVAIDRVKALIDGAPVEFHDIAMDLAPLPAFNRQVYAITSAIKPGETLTYGDVAKRLGDANAARAVGRALGENPFPMLIPCHRVLAAGGRAGGFSAPGGIETKMALLSIERARTSASPGLFDDDPAFRLAAKPSRR